MTPNPFTILAALACGKSSCPCATSDRRGQGLTHCPAHADDTPSLNVTPADSVGALIRCHQGCSNETVIAELRSRRAWPEEKTQAPTATKIVEEYDYIEDGELLWQVVRLDPKSFRQRRPDGKGGWVWTLGEVKRILYRLDKIRAAVALKTRIWIVEGEKDANALAAIDLASTTNPGGAGKWLDSYAAELVGADVVVIADKDEAGRKHAKHVAQSVEIAAKSVRILEMPGEAKDVSDWLKVNGTSAEETRTKLDALASEAPEWRSAHSSRLMTATDRAQAYFDVMEARKRNDPDEVGYPTGLPWLDQAVAYRPGDSWLVVAATGVGKTGMLLTLQSALDDGGVPSLFASLEQPWVQLMDRQVAAMSGIDSWDIARGHLDEGAFDRLSGTLSRYMQRASIMVDEPSLTTAQLETYVRIAKIKYGVRIVFVDYAQRMADKDGDSEYLRVSRISNNLARIARELRVCVVAAAQINRRGAIAQDGEPPELNEIRDSGYLEQDASVVLALGRKEGAIEAKLAVRKNRHGQQGVFIPLAFDAKHVCFRQLSREYAA